MKLLMLGTMVCTMVLGMLCLAHGIPSSSTPKGVEELMVGLFLAHIPLVVMAVKAAITGKQ